MCKMVYKHLLVSLIFVCLQTVGSCKNHTGKIEAVNPANVNALGDSLNRPQHDDQNDIIYGHHANLQENQENFNIIYNNSVEDGWKPVSVATELKLTELPAKVEKAHPPKKYNPKTEKEKRINGSGLLVNIKENFDRRNDLIFDGDFILNPHTRFIKDINSLSESSELFQPFAFEHRPPLHTPISVSTQTPSVSQLVLPSDAEILIVKTKSNVAAAGSTNIESIVAPPSIKPPNVVKMGVTNFIYKDTTKKHPSKYQNKRPSFISSLDTNSPPYKFVTPIIEDILRSKYKKPSSRIPAARLIVKTKRFIQPMFKDSNMPLWDKVVLTFHKLTN